MFVLLHSSGVEMFGKELFIQCTVNVFRDCLSVCVCASFPYGFLGGMWDLTLLVPDYCILFLISTTDILVINYCKTWHKLTPILLFS